MRIVLRLSSEFTNFVTVDQIRVIISENSVHVHRLPAEFMAESWAESWAEFMHDFATKRNPCWKASREISSIA